MSNYFKQINKAINYIEENISCPLNAEEVAKEAGISKWYFQRIFRAMVGDTLKEYTLKRRLSLATVALLETDDKVVDIAFAHAFESHEVFIRAFKRAFKLTPSEFRKNRSANFLFNKKPKITSDYLSHLYKGITMQPEIKTIKTTNLVGLLGQIKPIIDNYENNQKVVSELWREFELNFRKLPDSSPTQKFGLLTGSKVDGQNQDIEYCAGIELESNDKLPAGFVARSIPGGEYAEFIHRHQASINNINHTFNYIYGSWLPKSDRKRGDGPEFVIYPRYFTQAKDAEIKIFIPLK